MRSNSLVGVVLLLALLASAVAAGRARAEDNPWDAGSSWLSVRAGYAKNSAEGAGNGGAGYGFGFSHMLGPTPVGHWKALGRRPLGFLRWTFFKDFSIGAYLHYEVLGRLGSSSEIEMPASVELVRHFRLRTAPRPYAGLGAGPFYRKTYRTGSDQAVVAVGGYLTTGMNLLVAPSQLVGLDLRLARVDARNVPPNPVFGGGETEATHWSIKLNYAITY